jgi:ABC-type multidrug transport system fused ATPase/permease subunit
MKQQINIIVNQCRKYLRIVNWLLRDAYFTQIWGRPARIFVFAALRLTCQLGAVTILYFYANALKSGENIDFLFFVLPARESFSLMWSIIISSFLLFTLASLFQYFSRVVSISLASAFEESSSRKAFNVVSRLPDPHVPEINELLKKNDFKRIPGDARRAGMTVRSIGYAVPQAISGLVATVAIILIDPALTLILGGLMMFIFMLQYPTNIKGSKHSNAFEKNISRVNKGTVATIRSFLLASQEKEQQAVAIDNLYEHQGFKAAIQAFAGRIRVIEESTLIMQVGGAFVISIAVFYIGSRLSGGIANWGLLLAYIASLRIALNGVVQIGRTMTGVSRFYPQLVRYHSLLSAQSSLDRSAPALIAGERLLIFTNGAAGSQIELALPQRVALYTPDRIDRGLFHLFNYAKVKEASGEERTFGNSLRLITYAEACSKATGQFNVSCLSASDVFFVESKALSSAPTKLWKTIRDKAFVLIIYTDLQQPPVHGESTLLFWVESQVRGATDLSEKDFKSVAMDMEDLFKHQKRMEQSVRVDEEQDEDE